MRKAYALPHIVRAALATWLRGEAFGEWATPLGFGVGHRVDRGRLRRLLGRFSLTARQSAEVRDLEERHTRAVFPPLHELPLATRLTIYRQTQRAAQAAKLRAAAQERIRRYETEIVRRGGEVSIVGNYGVADLTVSDERDGYVLLRAQGWRQYSRRFGARMASLCYLCGEDSNGPWAVRVPGTVRSVTTALEWVTPTAVRQAQARDRKVLRQGDVYAVETRTDRAGESAANLDRTANAHVWDEALRVLKHNPRDGRMHADLHVDYPCRFVQQRVYRMGRSGRRGAGD